MFKDAPEGIEEHEIWKRREVRTVFTLDGVIEPLIEQRSVLILRSDDMNLWSDLMMQMTFAKPKYVQEPRSFVVNDPTEKAQTTALMINRHAHSEVKRFAHWMRVHPILHTRTYVNLFFRITRKIIGSACSIFRDAKGVYQCRCQNGLREQSTPFRSVNEI